MTQTETRKQIQDRLPPADNVRHSQGRMNASLIAALHSRAILHLEVSNYSLLETMRQLSTEKISQKPSRWYSGF